MGGAHSGRHTVGIALAWWVAMDVAERNLGCVPRSRETGHCVFVWAWPGLLAWQGKNNRHMGPAGRGQHTKVVFGPPSQPLFHPFSDVWCWDPVPSLPQPLSLAVHVVGLSEPLPCLRLKLYLSVNFCLSRCGSPFVLH